LATFIGTITLFVVGVCSAKEFIPISTVFGNTPDTEGVFVRYFANGIHRFSSLFNFGSFGFTDRSCREGEFTPSVNRLHFRALWGDDSLRSFDARDVRKPVSFIWLRSWPHESASPMLKFRSGRRTKVFDCHVHVGQTTIIYAQMGSIDKDVGAKTRSKRKNSALDMAGYGQCCSRLVVLAVEHAGQNEHDQGQ
jgi:hypothetical protein